MRLASMWTVVLLVFASALPLRAQDQTPAPTEASAADVLAALMETKSDTPLILHLEATLGPATIGYGLASLSPTPSDAAASVKYSSESVIIMPDRTRLEMQVHARLTQRFEPVEIELRRDVIPKDGERQTTINRAELSTTEVALSRSSGGDQVGKQSVPRPVSPFVFGMEFLIQRVDAKRFPSFVLQEFNPQKGMLIAQHFKSGAEPDGGLRLVSRKDDGNPGYSFQLDPKGALQSWGEPPVPVVFKACTAEKFEEVKKLFQK